MELLMVDQLFARFDGAYSKTRFGPIAPTFLTTKNGARLKARLCSRQWPTVANYVDFMAGERSVATIQRRVASEAACSTDGTTRCH